MAGAVVGLTIDPIFGGLWGSLGGSMLGSVLGGQAGAELGFWVGKTWLEGPPQRREKPVAWELVR